jgi:transposase
MARPVVAKKVHHYTNEFKVQAVRLSLHPDIQTQDVARALDIHPFMLSRWKKDYREGRLKPVATPRLAKVLQSRAREAEVRRLQRKVQQLEAKVQVQVQVRMRNLERQYEALRVENDLLKKAIRFNIERRRRSSNS